MTTQRVALALIVFVAFSVVGCSRKESAQQSTPAPSTAEQPSETKAVHESTAAEPVPATGSSVDLMAKAHEHESELGRIIQDGQLAEVHKHTFAIRDLVAAAVERAANISEPQKTELNRHLVEVRTLAGELDEAGDSGNLSKTKSLFAEFQAHLRATEKILGLSTR